MDIPKMRRKGSEPAPRNRQELARHLRDHHGWCVVSRQATDEQLNRHHVTEHRFANANHNHNGGSSNG